MLWRRMDVGHTLLLAATLTGVGLNGAEVA